MTHREYLDALRRELHEAWGDELAAVPVAPGQDRRWRATRREALQALWIAAMLLALFGLYGCLGLP
jgi:hypothetical protein